ncbi:hypothetical protein OUZ56_001035 [Daphnia magna]|uniref:Uncharacterized protein n=1 Tax=Daphnia magna TaxID=35525 RepID=A0ABR0A231_9CRUS|nr:hypothetical protein OUZ56_001035 [Daphnia magna]
MYKSLVFVLLFVVASMTVAVDAAPYSSSDWLSFLYSRRPTEVVYEYSPEYYGQSADGKTSTLPDVFYFGSDESLELEDFYERPRLVATKDLTLRDILARISARADPVY